MAQFTVTVNAQVNQPPSRIGDRSLSLTYNELYVFTIADFTTNTFPTYQDPEGDNIENVQIITLPSVGTLLLNAVPVIALDEISEASISGGLLTYQADPADTDGYVDSAFTFDLSDQGSSTFSGLTPGIVTFTVGAEINLPPSSVGDNDLVTNYGQTIVFTTANFTTETTPVYVDPEGDPAECLQVLTLPITGTLQLNAVDVIVNQEITFTDIGLGLFTFVPDNGVTSTYDINFEHQIKDSGSGNYTV